MLKPTTHNVTVGGGLGEFVASNVGDFTSRDNGRTEHDKLERLKAELASAFAAPDSAYQPLDADTVIRRSQVEKAVRF